MTQAPGQLGALPTVPARLDHRALALEGEADLTDTWPKARPCPERPRGRGCTPMLPAGPSDSATRASSPRRGRFVLASPGSLRPCLSPVSVSRA